MHMKRTLKRFVPFVMILLVLVVSEGPVMIGKLAARMRKK